MSTDGTFAVGRFSEQTCRTIVIYKMLKNPVCLLVARPLHADLRTFLNKIYVVLPQAPP